MPVTPAVTSSGQPVMPDMTAILGQQSQAAEGTGEQLKAKLDDMFANIEDEYRKLNTGKFSAGNKADRDRLDALREVMDYLKNMGIDLSNPQQIRELMDKMEQQDPDLLKLFADAMNQLLGGQVLDLGAVPEGPAPEGGPQGAMGMIPGGLDISQLPGMAPGGPQAAPGGLPMPPTGGPASTFPNLMR